MQPLIQTLLICITERQNLFPLWVRRLNWLAMYSHNQEMIHGHLLLITKVHFNSKIQFLDLLDFSQIIMITLKNHTMHAIVKLGKMKSIKQNTI